MYIFFFLSDFVLSVLNCFFFMKHSMMIWRVEVVARPWESSNSSCQYVGTTFENLDGNLFVRKVGFRPCQAIRVETQCHNAIDVCYQQSVLKLMALSLPIYLIRSSLGTVDPECLVMKRENSARNLGRSRSSSMLVIWLCHILFAFWSKPQRSVPSNCPGQKKAWLQIVQIQCSKRTILWFHNLLPNKEVSLRESGYL